MKDLYTPHPIDTSSINLDKSLEELTELLARNVHEVWAESRIKQGWQWGEHRNDELKLHQCLVPYEELTEEERDYDRKTAMETLKLIHSLGFKIVRENK